MYWKHSLNAINQLVESMPDLSELERYNAFATIKVLGSELNEYATDNGMPHGTISMILTDVYQAAHALAGLSDRGDRDDTYYVAEAYAAIDKLGMPMYFGEVAEG
jgi:hypothetical protein